MGQKLLPRGMFMESECCRTVDKQVSDRFEFGRYPQGANGEVEPITWRVLQRNSDSLLVIAEQGLDAKPYNEEFCDITWADCTLRRWLNGEFFNKAFNEQEQSLIKTSYAIFTIKNQQNMLNFFYKF